MRVGRALALCAAVALTLAACSDESASPSTTAPRSAPIPTAGTTTTSTTLREPELAAQLAELDAARARWAAQPQTYEYSYQWGCYCNPVDVHMRVLGGRTVEQVANGDDLTVIGNVENWLFRVGLALDSGHGVTVQYDDATGSVSELYVNPDPDISDDEWWITDGSLVVVNDPIQEWFTERSGCVYGFFAATADQKGLISIGLSPELAEKFESSGEVLIADLPRAKIDFGRDLLAHFCTDVVSSSDPSPVVAESWDLVGGSLHLTAVAGGTATAALTEVTAVRPDGVTVSLGDVRLINRGWGLGI